MEKGSLPVEYKGKSLSEINLDENFEYPEEEDDTCKDHKVCGKKTKTNLCNSLKCQEVTEGVTEKDKAVATTSKATLCSGVECPSENTSDSDDDVLIKKTKKNIKKKKCKFKIKLF